MAQLVLKLMHDSRVRGMIAQDGIQRFSVYDFISIIARKSDDGAYARKTFGNLIKEGNEYREELSRYVYSFKFPGLGQRETPTMTIRGLARLLQILGGKVAAEFRKEVEEIFTRYTAGDMSMVEEIEANAASDAPLNSVFREALVQEPIQAGIPDAPPPTAIETVDPILRKRQFEREDMLLALEVDERRQRLRSNALGDVKTGIEIFKMLYPAGPMDDRFALQMEDLVKNILFTPGASQPCIGNGSPVPAPPVNPTQSISVSVVVAEMGFTKATDAQVQAIGKRMAAKYREAYGCEPTKHKQYVKGNYIPVNSYVEKDRAMMEAAVREVLQA